MIAGSRYRNLAGGSGRSESLASRQIATGGVHLKIKSAAAGQFCEVGDLDAEELQEWEELSQDPRCKLDTSLEQAAAAIDAEFSLNQEHELSENLLGQLQKDMAQFVQPEGESVAEHEAGQESEAGKIVSLPTWKRVLMAPQTPWAVAALLAILLVASVMIKDKQPSSDSQIADTPAILSPQEARDAIINRDGVVQMKFGGTEGYASMSGNVIWSDELQEGYMTLTNLPVNNPGKKQYQLWIVDPTRDEKPVDGGVFDIPEGADTAVIKINNPLVISDPKAFVITLEQPGGVVVSKQEEVVAIAKPS